MDIDCALDIVVGRTGHIRYRELCDPNHPDHDPGFIPLVIAMASEPARVPEPEASPPSNRVASHLAFLARMKACPSWEASSSCGCGVNRCRAGKGSGLIPGQVSHADCRTCLEGETVAIG